MATRRCASPCRAPTCGPPTTSAASAPSSTRCSRRAGRCRSPTPPAAGLGAADRDRRWRALRRPRSGPGCPSSWTRWSPGRSGPSGQCRARAHRGRGAPAARRGRGRGRPHRAVPARARRRALRPRTTSGRTVRRAHTTPDPDRRRKLLVGLAGLAIAVLLVLGFVGAQVGSLFFDGRGAPVIVVGNDAPPRRRARPPPPRRPHLPGERRSPSPGSRSTTPPATPTTRAAVSRVIDGKLDTNWRTFEYRQQFPALKPGVGIMVSFASAVQLTAVAVESPSPGTVIQVRSAQAADAALDDTTVMAEGTLGEAAPRSRWPGASPSPTSCCGSRSWAGAARRTSRRSTRCSSSARAAEGHRPASRPRTDGTRHGHAQATGRGPGFPKRPRRADPRPTLAP